MTPAPTVDELRARPVVTVREAAAVLGLGRDAAYAAAARGQIPTLRIGRRILVPTAGLLALVGQPLTIPGNAA